MIRDSKVSNSRIAELHPLVRVEVLTTIEHVERERFPDGRTAIRVVQGLRSIAYQDGLYAQGRTKPGKIVTKARGGSSYHNFGLAIDFALLYDKNGDGVFEELSWNTLRDMDKDGERDWQEVVKAFKAIGWRWGGDFNSIKDEPHLEKTFDLKVSQLYTAYKTGKLIAGTQYVRIPA